MSDATSVVVYDPHTTDREVIAAAGFLAGYSGRTREAYTLDPRQFVGWCREHGLGLFDIRRAEIELYARHLEQQGKARATIGRRLSTIAGFYRYAAEEGTITHSPAANVRRPRLDYESHAVGLDRNELGAFLVAAGSEVGDVAREIVDRDPDPTALVNALRGERIGHSRADTSWQLLFDEFRIQAARRDDVRDRLAGYYEHLRAQLAQLIDREFAAHPRSRLASSHLRSSRSTKGLPTSSTPRAMPSQATSCSRSSLSCSTR